MNLRRALSPRQILAISLLLLLLAGSTLLGQHIQRNTESRPSESQYWADGINTSLLQRFLGLRIVGADILWLDLYVKADTSHESSPLTAFYRAAKSILVLDPNDYFGAWLSGLYLSVVKDDIKGASEIFQAAVSDLDLKNWVNPRVKGALYFAYGYHLLFEEGDLARASEFIGKASREAGAPLLAKGLAESMKSETGQIEIGFRILNAAYKRAMSASERSQIEKKMTSLLARKELVVLNQQFAQYRSTTDVRSLKVERAFQHFMRSINHSGKSILGKRLFANPNGEVVAQ